jgi:ABC-type transport system involved in cytochrome bd biosynthesis fused ATPase/permease subunit
VYYSEILTALKEVAGTSRLSFEAKSINYKFKSGKLGLREIAIYEETGNLIALMGASGAGKSTLLHVLNGSEFVETQCHGAKPPNWPTTGRLAG